MMRSRLENYVGQMRTQTMTFSNEGVELCLNIPDNASVKETLQMFINTIVQQQDQIADLQSTMKQMSIENLIAQKSIISWTSELVAETQMSLQEKINESSGQVQNFVYNVQGFADKNKNDQPNLMREMGSNFAAPVLQLAKDFEDVGDGNPMLLPNASEAIKSNNSVSTKGSVKSDPGSQKKKTVRMPRPESKEYYNLVRKNSLPDLPAARWRWVFRRVVRNIRNDKLQVALTRLRVVKGASIVERLGRLESEMFNVPANLQESLRKKAEEIAQYAQRDSDSLHAEMEKLAAQLEAQKEKSENLSFLMSGRIDEVKANCAHLDRTCDDLDRAVSKLSAMRRQAKVSQKKLDGTDSGKGKKNDDDKIDVMSGDKGDPSKSRKSDGDKSERAELGRVNRVDSSSGKGKKSGSEKGAKSEKAAMLVDNSSDIKSGIEKKSEKSVGRKLSTEGLHVDLAHSSDAIDVESSEESNTGAFDDSGDRIDAEIDSLNRRMNCTEKCHVQTLQGKVHDLQTEVGLLQDNTNIALKQMIKCKARLNMVPSSSSEVGSVGDSVASLSQLDKDLKSLHHTRWALDSRVSALRDLHRSLRGEILFSAAPSVRRKADGARSPRAFTSEESKQAMLNQCDEVLVRIQGISASLSDSDSQSVAYSAMFGQQWNTLVQLMNPKGLGLSNISIIETQQSYPGPGQSGPPSPQSPMGVSPMGMKFLSPIPTLSPNSHFNQEVPAAFHSPVMDKLKKDMQSRASLEDIRVISRETVTGALAHALGPIRTKIESLEVEIATLKGDLVVVKDSASVDRKWMQATAEEMKRRDEEQKKREAEQRLREEEQKKRDEEQRKKDMDQRTQDDRRNYEDEQRRRDDDQRRQEEEQKQGDDLQQRDLEAGEGLPPGIIACSRQEIEISSKSDATEDEEEETVLNDVSDKARAKTAAGSKFPGARKNPSLNNRIEEGASVNIVSGNYRGQQGIVVNIREIPKDDESPSDRVQYHVKLDYVIRPLVSPLRRSRPGSSMPTSRRRDGEEKILPRTNLEIMKLRDEIQQMEITLKTLGREKITGYQAQQMIEQRTANQGSGDDKVDNEAFAVVEVAVRNLASELDDLRNLQARRLATVKKQLEESFQHLTLHQSHSVETEGGGPYSAVITTGQCLGCGRLSAINGAPNVLHNPETVRAGFRMPHVTPQIAPFRSISPGPIGGSETEHLAGGRPISAALVSKSADLSGNQHTASESVELFLDSAAPQYRTTRPRTSSGTFSASQRTSSRGAAAAGLVPVASGVMVQSQSHKRLGSDEVASRTLQRSGFIGKKSAKAEHVFAPERFDPPPDFSLPHYNKLTSVALAAGIKKPI